MISAADGIGRALTRLLGPIRLRLAGLILVAAIPLLILAGTITWQNYRLALDASGATAIRLRESAIARHADAIDDAQQMLQVLARVPDLTGPDRDGCRQHLIGALNLQRARYTNFAVFDAAGGLHCSALPPPPGVPPGEPEAQNRALLHAVASAKGFRLGPVRDSVFSHTQVIPAAYPIMQGGTPAGFVFAGLRMDWFGGTQAGVTPELTALWIADDAGQVTQIAAGGGAGLPDAATLQALLASPTVIDAPSATGRSPGAPFAYASAGLAGGYRLIVAYSATADKAMARAVLFTRIGQLAVLLAVGLAAVAIGTHRALVEPLDQLSLAVTRWRQGGIFDPSLLRAPPTEVHNLALSFAEATRTLAEHSRKLTLAAEQQDLLIKEIHHRVKNNLQIVASLLNLQASRIRAPAARAEFASARDRVRALATLHRHLYSQGELTTIDMRPFLTELCGQVFEAMGERQGGRIQLAIDAVALQMTSDQAVPLSLIVTEAVSNSVKYAFPGGRHGHVAVTLATHGDTAELTIKDDGIGIPAGRAETESGTRDGLGLTLIRGFAKQLRAKLTIVEDQGTCYSVVIPLHQQPDEPAA